MVGSGWAKPFAGSPDEAPGWSFDERDSCEYDGEVIDLAADEARRRRCDPADTCVADGEARLWKTAKIEERLLNDR